MEAVHLRGSQALGGRRPWDPRKADTSSAPSPQRLCLAFSSVKWGSAGTCRMRPLRTKLKEDQQPVSWPLTWRPSRVSACLGQETVYSASGTRRNGGPVPTAVSG